MYVIKKFWEINPFFSRCLDSDSRRLSERTRWNNSTKDTNKHISMDGKQRRIERVSRWSRIEISRTYIRSCMFFSQVDRHNENARERHVGKQTEQTIGRVCLGYERRERAVGYFNITSRWTSDLYLYENYNEILDIPRCTCKWEWTSAIGKQ